MVVKVVTSPDSSMIGACESPCSTHVLPPRCLRDGWLGGGSQTQLHAPNHRKRGALFLCRQSHVRRRPTLRPTLRLTDPEPGHVRAPHSGAAFAVFARASVHAGIKINTKPFFKNTLKAFRSISMIEI